MFHVSYKKKIFNNKNLLFNIIHKRLKILRGESDIKQKKILVIKKLHHMLAIKTIINTFYVRLYYYIVLHLFNVGPI